MTYKVIRLMGGEVDEFKLNELAAAGWQLVAVNDRFAFLELEHD